jgi:Flp pilus assembly protein TadD
LDLNKLNPEVPEVNSLLGKLYGQYMGNLDSAAFFLLKATNLAPENPASFKDLGIVYGLQKDYPRALQAFQRALNLEPNDPQTKQNIAITYGLIEQNAKKSN